ncbi:MAG: hypothetical protein H7Y38_16615 [Armatimonadetes bacterium]|nr:hypothetical protein [Armatimonadota bacterium]
MATDSLVAANRLYAAQSRSSVSRYYYASYQGVSALLLYVGATPPEGREAWAHELTPDLLVEHLRTVIPRTGRRQDLANRLRRLYKVRVSADYISADDVEGSLESVRKDAHFLIKVMQDILPEMPENK